MGAAPCTSTAAYLPTCLPACLPGMAMLPTSKWAHVVQFAAFMFDVGNNDMPLHSGQRPLQMRVVGSEVVPRSMLAQVDQPKAACRCSSRYLCANDDRANVGCLRPSALANCYSRTRIECYMGECQANGIRVFLRQPSQDILMPMRGAAQQAEARWKTPLCHWYPAT